MCEKDQGRGIPQEFCIVKPRRKDPGKSKTALIGNDASSADDAEDESVSLHG